MTTVNYLDGLPSVQATGERKGRWNAFPSGHARAGSSFFVADPYWWDGVYPNGIAFGWANQGTADREWSVCFWTSPAATNGVFFKVATRADWMVTLPADYSSVPEFRATKDGRTRIQMGTISGSTETVVVERYVDTWPFVGDSTPAFNDTSGYAMFCVARNSSGWVAAASGPRVLAAFSFDCSSVFSSLPQLLTRSWETEDTAVPRPRDSAMGPKRVTYDFGAFTIAHDQGGFALDLRGNAHDKPHGPERSNASATHYTLDEAAAGIPKQRDVAELVSVGAYMSAGNRPIPYAAIGSNPTTVTVTITPTSTVTNGAPGTAGTGFEYGFRAIPSRTFQTTLAGLQGLGTRIFFPTQSVAVGTFNVPDQPEPIFDSGGAGAKTTIGYWAEYPSYGDLSSAVKSSLSEEAYAGAVLQAQSRLNDLEYLIAEWTNPNSSLQWSQLVATPNDTSGGPRFFMVGTQRFDQRTRITNQVFTSGNLGSCFVDLSPRWAAKTIQDTSPQSYSTNTSEGMRQQSVTQQRGYAATCGNIVARNHNPFSNAYTQTTYFEQIERFESPASVTIGLGPFGGFGFVTLATSSGQSTFNHVYARNKAGPNVGILKSTAHPPENLSSQFVFDYIFTTGDLPAAKLRALLRDGTVSHDTTAIATRPGNPPFLIGEFTATVTYAIS